MFNRLADGLAGFFVFFANWISPIPESSEVRFSSLQEVENRYVISCEINLNWNEELSDIVDAGIPIRMNIRSYSNRGDTVTIMRQLLCSIENYRYTITDTLYRPVNDSVFISQPFTLIHRAVKDFTRWELSFDRSAESFHVEAELLPSPVSGLNRMVDIAEIAGNRKFTRDLYKGTEPSSGKGRN